MTQRTDPPPVLAAAILLLSAIVIAAVLAPIPEKPAAAGKAVPRVLLIGLDGADWVMLDHWFEQGELPVMARLAETGLRGDLRTLRPIISPLVWTSIATGQTPDRHGVTDFYAAMGSDSAGGVSRHSVRVPCLWDILSVRGQRVIVTAWWATWPADRTLDGRVVTDQVHCAFPGAPSPDSGSRIVPDPETMYHPAELEERLATCAAFDREAMRRASGTIAPGRMPDTTRMTLSNTLAATVTYYRMTRKMLRDEQPEFATIYFMGTDTVAHLFGGLHEETANYQAPLRYYRLVDAMVGDLCSMVSPDTLVVLVSDHGFYTGEDRPSSGSADFRGHAASWHRPLGMVLFNGPWIGPGRLDDASVLDIAPTLLWQLLGERFDFMPGRVLVEQRMAGAAGPGADHRPVVSGDTSAGSDPAVPSPDSYREYLTALGYIGEEPEHPALAARPAIHLADYLQWAGRPDEALNRLLEARELMGDNPELLGRLAIQQSRAENFSGAFETLETAIGEKQPPFGYGWNPAASHQLAVAVGICCAAGRPDRGEDLLDAFAPEWIEAPSSRVLTARAVMAEHRGRRREAVDGYAAALRADPANGHAAHSICRLLEAGDPLLDELRTVVHQAAGERTGEAPVQLNAGRLLLAVGDADAARHYLGRAVYLEPDLVEPRLLLGSALYISGRPAEAHERLSEGLAWHPAHPRLLAAAGAAAIRSGYRARGAELLQRAAEAGASGPHLEAVLSEIR